ncbi:MAG: ferritin-like domain-containing protein [Gammaproteobacteria bacterium]|nr:ferritin-like domain-containing protein [Gammaproteobacteria bacterium]
MNQGTRQEFRAAALAALIECDQRIKCELVAALWQAHQSHTISLSVETNLPAPEIAGRPARPELVHPARVPKRRLGSAAGRAALLHALAHIEFNAINLALDAIARFADLPAAYYADWLHVASEEAHHFQLLLARLRDLGQDYGDFPAHEGLWEAASKTRHDVLARMGLVPRILEARGLDVTPGLQQRLREVGDEESAAILDIILRDEIGHVAIGNRWFEHLCEVRGLDPADQFLALCRAHGVKTPQPPFNMQAREAAGFSPAELARFLTLAAS